MLNRCVLIGRLTKEVTLKYTTSGKAVASFCLAVDRMFKNQAGEKEADFINIVVWGAQAEPCANYLDKGKMAAVDGRLQIRSFNGQDGQKRWVTEVVAENVRFLSPKSPDSHGDGYEPATGGQAPPSGQAPPEDDIPF